jgi:tetratricopeptide (TPR) repeat protein
LAAKALEENSQFEWAVREYQRSIDKEEVASHAGILARVYLANLLHDYEQHQRAADTLEALVKAVRGDGRVGQLYTNLHRHYSRNGGSVLPEAETLAARLHYFRACQYRQAEDWPRVRDELNHAIRADPKDADVLIAMYRVPDADDKWRQQTLAKIRELLRDFQREIDDDPSDPTPYNQWAWLVSNTEGDYQQAIRYSHRSLELNTNGDSADASYLDTLGRCYYAAGDYENALKYQRQAVERVDYMQVMQRQLALFEKTLAEKKANGEQSSSNSK